MKFLAIHSYDVAKAAEVAAASDKLMVNMPKGYKPLVSYICLAQLFPGLPQHTIMTVNITEADSAEAMAAISYPLMLAGATIHRIPVMEIQLGTSTKVEKELGR